MARNKASIEIEEIKSKIRILRRELREKKRGQTHSKIHRAMPHSQCDSLWLSKLNLIDVYKKSSYTKTVTAMIKGSLLYEFFIKSLSFFRKFRLISYIALFLSYAVALVGTGAILLVYLSAFAVVLFFSLFFLLNFIIVAGARRKKANSFFEKELANKTVCIFPVTRAQKFRKNSFFAACVNDFANESCDVLIVTPSIYGTLGFDGKKRKGFVTFRREDKNIFLLRSHYYFSFKKKILPKIKDKVILIF